MSEPASQEIVQALLRRHGQTFAEELDIPLAGGTASPLFRLLCASLLFSARIQHKIAIKAARALAEQGWTRPERLAAATWEERTRTLNRSGYARYDERTSTMLGQTAELLLQRYDGDLSNLRQQAGRDPVQERERLKEFKGIGDVGVDIFFREVQVAWDELWPFADDQVLQAAAEVGLPADAQGLLALAGPDDFPRLAAALVRMRLEGDQEGVLAAARHEET